MRKKQKPSKMNVSWVIPSIPKRREHYGALQTSKNIQSSLRADTGCSPPSRIMTRIRNLALLPSPNGDESKKMDEQSHREIFASFNHKAYSLFIDASPCEGWQCAMFLFPLFCLFVIVARRLLSFCSCLFLVLKSQLFIDRKSYMAFHLTP